MGAGASTIALAEVERPRDAADLLAARDPRAAALREVARLRAIGAAVAPGEPPLDPHVARLLALDGEGLAARHEKVLALTIKREAERKKEAVSRAARNDYSQCFSGTADDTKNEAEAAALLKGGEGVGGGGDQTAAGGEYALLAPLGSNVPAAQLKALAASGKWLKFMASNECWSYVHGMTLEVRGIRPPEYVDEKAVAAAEAKEAAEAQAKAASGPRRVAARDVPDLLRATAEAGRTTLLLVDATRPDGEASTVGEPSPLMRFFQSYDGGVVADLSPLGLTLGQQRKAGLKPKAVVEEGRCALVKALQTGGTLVLSLGHICADVIDVEGKVCKKPLGGPKTFPVQVFQRSGKAMLEHKRYERVFRDEDKDITGACMFSLKFRTVVVSEVEPSMYKRELAGCFPTGFHKWFDVVVVEP